MQPNHSGSILLVRVPSGLCALPLAGVIETMRPLPVSPVPNAPDFIAGMAVIRGEPTPVVDVEALFDPEALTPAGRFVTVRTGDRVIALSVSAVIGVLASERLSLSTLPPLLNNTRRELIETIATLDSELLVVLRASALIPEAEWKSLGICETLS